MPNFDGFLAFVSSYVPLFPVFLSSFLLFRDCGVISDGPEWLWVTLFIAPVCVQTTQVGSEPYRGLGFSIGIGPGSGLLSANAIWMDFSLFSRLFPFLPLVYCIAYFPERSCCGLDPAFLSSYPTSSPSSVASQFTVSRMTRPYRPDCRSRRVAWSPDVGGLGCL